MLLEVIATNVNEAKIAFEHGADRIELITGITEGGLTPSYSLIKEVVQAVDIPVHVMVRPHHYSFCYDDEEIQIICEDIEIIRRLGASGIVIGVLTGERKIDEERLKTFICLAGDLDITFHRAFDEVSDQEEALQTLLKYPEVNRILTSGGKKSALEAVPQITKLVSLARDTHLSIIAGNGLTVNSLEAFVQHTEVQEVHLGSGVRCGGKSTERMDPKKISEISTMII
ncbi:copper homeostasis protein CutC [Halobacillus shinanisalinarum]|uniref:PF03932 family protein CutC n=1 Tax=Halobacillus shinanisalinarum TaxID=2932258 RepID=A0ABY4GV31_9BACI|nr:copper homeostasis protein CutC [Halobacillus shinanisalinarum]UOQ91894.1 copper homeostasis protein CutC [Halobacillus shinanisalinarum]